MCRFASCKLTPGRKLEPSRFSLMPSVMPSVCGKPYFSSSFLVNESVVVKTSLIILKSEDTSQDRVLQNPTLMKVSQEVIGSHTLQRNKHIWRGELQTHNCNDLCVMPTMTTLRSSAAHPRAPLEPWVSSACWRHRLPVLPPLRYGCRQQYIEVRQWRRPNCNVIHCVEWRHCDFGPARL